MPKVTVAYLGVSTCLPSVLSRDGVWVSSTERFAYVSVSP
jgi:hypothetical protein